MEQTDLVKCISDFLQRKRYVIVLDDIWEIDAWEALRRAFPNNNRGSRVIITTRYNAVALFAHSGKVHNLLPLPIDESRTLFCRKAFQNDSCPSSLKETMEAILKKCEGLPLAIVAIGGLLATKGERINEWNKISRGLGAELRKEGKLANLDKVLSLSYFDLPWYLKPCFLYLSIFPKDYSIHRRHLLRLWIAEGFVHSTEVQTAEEVAGSYLAELTHRSLILIKDVGLNGRAKEYHIHDIWRELIISRSIKHDLVTVYGAEQNVFPHRVRRLSIHNEVGTRKVFKYRATHLRSLFMFGSIVKKSTSPIVDSLGDRSKLLKVLSLRGNRNLEEIPKSIGDLQMLEILDLKDTGVRKLPDEILKLRRLRFLLVCSFPGGFTCHHGFKALKGMGVLSSLEKLCTIELNDLFQKKKNIEPNDERNNNNDILRSISELSRLRKVNIIGLRSRDAKELCSTLEKLTVLRSLCIATTEILSFRWRESIDLETLRSPSKYLQTLIVKANMERLPQWIASLPCLTKLILNDCGLEEDPLPQLQDLPKLIYLQLNRAYEGESLCFKAGTFRKLTTLRLDLLRRLKHVSVMEGAMPRLEKLSICNCRMMKELPSGMETLSSLSLLSFYGLSPAFPSKLIPDLKNGNAFEIAHIPTVCVEGDGNSMTSVGDTDN